MENFINYKIIKYSSAFFFLVIIILFCTNTSESMLGLPRPAGYATSKCSYEYNPTEKIFCVYRELGNYIVSSRLDKNIYKNDPLFKNLIPIANNLISLEKKDISQTTQLAEKYKNILGQGTAGPAVISKNKGLTEEESLMKSQIAGQLEEQIESVFKNISEREAKRRAEEERKEKLKNTTFIILGIIFILFIIYVWRRNYIHPTNVEKRRRRREEKRIAFEERARVAQAERELEQQQRELERQQAKEKEISQYKQLRKEIEAMPQYQYWRKEVLKKFDKKCSICGSTKNIEVDHRYESFYAIIKKYRIQNVTQAYECSALWDINNGAPLCKQCHDKTKSSIYHQKKNSVL